MHESVSLEGLRVLVLSLDRVDGDPRPTRLVKYLHGAGAVVTVRDGSQIAAPQSIAQETRNLVRRILQRIVALLQYAILLADNQFRLLVWQSGASRITADINGRDHGFDVVVLESYQFLPIVTRWKGDFRIIVDLREFYPAQHEDRLTFKVLRRPVISKLLRVFLPRCSAAVTVSSFVADAYHESFGIRPLVLESRSDFPPLSIGRGQRPTVRLVHHGVANRNRRIESLIELQRELGSSYELHLFLVGNPDYQRFLREYAVDIPEIYFHEPVPFQEIPSTVAEFDIGLCYFYPTTRNLLWCLPNKFFEYVCGGVPIVSGPSPAMAHYIDRYGLGRTSTDFSPASLADAIRDLVPHLDETASRCRKSAPLLSFGSQVDVLCLALGVSVPGNISS